MASQVNEAAKVAMAKASLHAGIAFSNAVLGLAHAMTHQVGGLLDLPIGEISAVLLPFVMRFNLISRVDKCAAIAAAMGAHTEAMSQREAAEKPLRWCGSWPVMWAYRQVWPNWAFPSVIPG